MLIGREKFSECHEPLVTKDRSAVQNLLGSGCCGHLVAEPSILGGSGPLAAEPTTTDTTEEYQPIWKSRLKKFMSGHFHTECRKGGFDNTPPITTSMAQWPGKELKTE